MARPFLTDTTKTSPGRRRPAVEAGSSAELVIAVRPRSGSYLHADLLAGLAGRLAALAVLLYSPWMFGAVWFVARSADRRARWALLVSRSAPALRRASHARVRPPAPVETAARSTFVERRIHRTTGRTGILLYVSAARARGGRSWWTSASRALAATDGWRTGRGGDRERGPAQEDGVAVAAPDRSLAPLLRTALVRGENDVDELPNEVC